MTPFTVCLTHDVDRVRKTYQYVTHDLLHARFSNLGSFLGKRDPYWMFERLIAIESKYDVRSTFFFLEESIKPRLLSPESWKLAFGRYKFSDPNVANVIRELDADGWEIGLHGSYKSYINRDLLAREKQSLEEVLGKPVIGIRQHYLNLDIPHTWTLQKQVGLLYDTSYGKKKDIGFPNDRYQPFIDRTSQMFVLPLALMEGYLFDKGSNLDKIWAFCLKLIEAAERNQAVFTLLWHQRMFNEDEFPGVALIYEQLIQECQNRGAAFKTCGEVYKELTR